MDINDLNKYRLTEIELNKERMKWESIDDGDRPEIAVLQIDIEGHSKILANDATLQRLKIEVRQAIQKTTSLFGAHLLKWEADGGALMFLTGKGQGFNRSVAAALTILESMPILNNDLKEKTDLTSPIHIRLSVSCGTVSYSRDANDIHSQFLNSFLKNEREIGVADTVCITHEVWRQLDRHLQNQFRRRDFSETIGSDIYQYGLNPPPLHHGAPVADGPAVRQVHGSFQEKARNLKRSSSWPLSVAPTLAVILVIIWGTADPLVVGLAIIPSVILVNSLWAWRKSRRDSGKDQSLIFSLLRDKLLPSKHGGPLMFEVKMVIIEDQAQQGEFVKSVERQFKQSCDSKELILVPFTLDSSESVTQKEVLHSRLEGAAAVVVVWTSFVEHSDWLFALINDWGHQQSDVPILFTDPADPTQKGSLPKNFYTIPRDSKSLPWRLMQRANERGHEWRGAANFNGVMVANASVIFLMVAILGGILLFRQKNTTETVSRELFNLMSSDTKDAFLRDYTGKTENGSPTAPSNNDIDISYWFIYEGIAQQFAATEVRDEHQTWRLDKNTAIGTAFRWGNHLATGRISDSSKKGERIPLQIWDNQDTEVVDPDAALLVERDRTIMVLSCVSYHRIQNYMIGICVFSENGNIYFKEGYRKFLRDKAKQLYERTSPHIANHNIAPLPKSLPPP